MQSLQVLDQNGGWDADFQKRRQLPRQHTDVPVFDNASGVAGATRTDAPSFWLPRLSAVKLEGTILRTLVKVFVLPTDCFAGVAYSRGQLSYLCVLVCWPIKNGGDPIILNVIGLCFTMGHNFVVKWISFHCSRKTSIAFLRCTKFVCPFNGHSSGVCFRFSGDLRQGEGYKGSIFCSQELWFALILEEGKLEVVEHCNEFLLARSRHENVVQASRSVFCFSAYPRSWTKLQKYFVSFLCGCGMPWLRVDGSLFPFSPKYSNNHWAKNMLPFSRWVFAKEEKSCLAQCLSIQPFDKVV